MLHGMPAMLLAWPLALALSVALALALVLVLFLGQMTEGLMLFKRQKAKSLLIWLLF